MWVWTQEFVSVASVGTVPGRQTYFYGVADPLYAWLDPELAAAGLTTLVVTPPGSMAEARPLTTFGRPGVVRRGTGVHYFIALGATQQPSIRL